MNTLGIITNETRPHFVQIEVSKSDLLKFAEISGEQIQMFAWDNAPHIAVTTKDDITIFFFTKEIFTDDEKNIIKIV